MTTDEALSLLADGEPRRIPRLPAQLLEATGAVEWVKARTLAQCLENKREGCPPVRITIAGRRRAPGGEAT